MDTLEQLLETRNRIDEEIKSRKADLVAKFKADMIRLGITIEDLGGSTSSAPRVGAKRPVKYRDDAGHTWTGVGQRPRWVRAAIAAGADLEQFRITS